MNAPLLKSELLQISEARHHDPFAVLGRHREGMETVVRAFIPHAAEVCIAEGGMELERLHGSGYSNGGELRTNCPITTG